ncbi:MAG: phosphoenolpyruvate synthase [Microgenomates bacterium OLB22]|nr:MAG: phosphoenolpyruvate synthase [Microgenomates bacterium OLB22]
MHQSIRWLEELDSTDASSVGGKAAHYGDLLNAGIPIPYGFVITRNVFEDLCHKHNIGALFASRSRQIDKEEVIISNLISTLPLDHYVMGAVAAAYHELPKRAKAYVHRKKMSTIHAFTGLYRLYPVEVELSANAYMPHSSQQSVTVHGENALFHTIRAQWSSLLRRYLLDRPAGSYQQMLAEAGSIIVRQAISLI